MTVRVSLKFATSLDGRIATAAGESRWITGEAARREGHRLRAAHDAILVGAGTALADDPELTVRLPDQPQARQPLRVVLDTRLRLSPLSRLARTLHCGPVLVIGGEGAQGEALVAAGVGVARAPLRDGRPDIAAVLALLAARGVRSVLVEGGGEVAASCIRARQFHAVEWFRAPVLLGGDGRPAVAALALRRLHDAPKLVRRDVRMLGADLWERYEAA